MTTIDSREATLTLFDDFRQELDEQNDRRERLIKSSRDITNLSKKAIFLLHRIATEDTQENEAALARRAAREGRKKLREIQNLFAGMKEELQGDLFWRHQRSISSGLQEYIEALSFTHYLEHGTLITYQEVHNTLADEQGVHYFPLHVSDYLLGLSDLTGELMRFAISAISRRGGRVKASQVCEFVRRCKADFAGMTPSVRGLNKKQAVTNQSLQKIEDAAYAIAVRTSEYDLPPDMLDDIVRRCVKGFDIKGYDRSRHRRDEEDFDSADEECQ